ncbi:tape measure protein [Magnetococcales bacterium HHB-1]
MAQRQETYSVRLTVEGGRQVVATLERVGDRGERSFNRIRTASQNATRELNSLDRRLAGGFRALGDMAANLPFLDVAGQLIMQADAYRTLQTRIRTATKETHDYAEVSQRLLEISNRTGTALEETVSVFQSLARAAPELGATNEQMLILTETVQQLGVIGGATPEGMKYGLLQFSQGLSAGIFRAEEFNSILENLPEVAVRIAKGMGKTVGELRKMVLDGKVLSNDVFQSLVKQAPEIAKEFENIPTSITRASTALSNSFSAFLGQLDEATGLTRRLASAMQSLADEMKVDPLASEKISVSNIKAEINTLQRHRKSVETGGFLQRWLFGDSLNRDEALANLDKAIGAAKTRLEGAEIWLKDQQESKPSKKLTKKPVKPITDSDKLLQSLNQELTLLQYRGRELAIQQALSKAHTKGIRDQDQAIRDLVGRIYDQKEATAAADKAERKRTQTAEKARREREAALQRDQQILSSLQQEIELIGMSDRQRHISLATRRLSAQATAEQRREVELLAGRLFDEKQAITERTKAEAAHQKLMARGRDITESVRTSQEAYQDEIKELNELLKAGAIDQETFARASEKSFDRMLSKSTDWTAGAQRALRGYIQESEDAGAAFEKAMTSALGKTEDALVEFATTGKLSIKGMADSILQDLTRIAIRQSITTPMAKSMNSWFSSAGSSGGGFFESMGSIIGGMFGGARAAGGPVYPGQTFLVGEKGPELFTPPSAGQIVSNDQMNSQTPQQVTVQMNINTPNADSFRASRSQIESEMIRAVRRAGRWES